MKRFPIWHVPMLAVAVTALGSTLARSAELQLMTPNDYALLKGAVTFQIRPQNTVAERFFENPYISFQNEAGDEIQQVPALFDQKTGICTVRVDTRTLPDGRYTAAVSYRVLVRGDQPETTTEYLTLGVRNGSTKPSRFTVKVANQPMDDEHPAEVTVRVLDRKGKPLPAARVTFKTDRGKPDTDAEITDRDGEVTTFVEHDDGGAVNLTVTVEDLPPVKRALNFKTG